MTFADFMDAALYDEADGFYATGRGAGRARDFVTSPELGPLFGAVLARALDTWWDELDRPDPFVVVEVGAGSGALTTSVLAASPRCAPALRYVLVERSAARREEHAARLALEPPAMVLGPTLAGEEEGERRTAPGMGPLAASLAEIPADPVIGVILANELLDNLPFLLCERIERGWTEVRVGAEDGHLVEVVVDAAEDLARQCEVLAPGATPGARVPIQRAAVQWLQTALESVARGRVVVIDYASQTAEMADRTDRGWLRTYRAHGRGGHPIADPGGQDITAEVAVDQLARVRAPTRSTHQAAFLDAHGLGDLVEQARDEWTERAAIGDLAALAARSRVGEGRALTDPAGLGAFTVLEWLIAP